MQQYQTYKRLSEYLNELAGNIQKGKLVQIVTLRGGSKLNTAHHRYVINAMVQTTRVKLHAMPSPSGLKDRADKLMKCVRFANRRRTAPRKLSGVVK